MPTISMFHGIIIRMYYSDHQPPHFHAEYQGSTATFDFDGNQLEGVLQQRQTRLILAWIELHKDELNANWELARQHEQLFRIQGL